ncbi:hypothetical protein TNCV_3928921 [Trichonephila clavipes]|nr:hypothetical protein TNCV_3928921 [Trichonephila clavipes]
MWMPQQIWCLAWLTEFKSVTIVQRRVRAERNIVTGLPNRLLRTPTKRITHMINSVCYHKNLMILAMEIDPPRTDFTGMEFYGEGGGGGSIKAH